MQIRTIAANPPLPGPVYQGGIAISQDLLETQVTKRPKSRFDLLFEEAMAELKEMSAGRYKSSVRTWKDPATGVISGTADFIGVPSSPDKSGGTP
jgi:hypothetical protein